jgi:5-methylcytosine-specific restriction endonuclease McrA
MNGTNGQEAFTLTYESEKDKNDFITVAALKRLIVKQNYVCAITGWELRPETATVDHIKPLARGGTNTLDNIQIVHGDANRAKGVMTQEEFLALCKAVTNTLSVKN